MKCRTVEELRSVKDGVTPDCYSYSNFIFRHLKKRDYTVGACIGSKVSRARQQDYEVDAQHLKKELEEAKPVSYTHLRAHETRHDLVCRLLLEKKKKKKHES